LAAELLHTKFDQFAYVSAGALPNVTTGCAVSATTPRYVIEDFSVAYHPGDKWEVTAFVHNISDALNYTGAYTLPSLFRSLTLANVAAPRTAGVRLSAHF
jgi:outer membrane receptor protein involved in Fe transport